MNIKTLLQDDISKIINELYTLSIDSSQITVELTRSEFEGDYTLVVFPLVKLLKSNPQTIAESIGIELKKINDQVDDFNIIKGFLNIKFKESFWKDILIDVLNSPFYGSAPTSEKKYLLEFCSPNTNKPLHLGHIRNILIGWSMSKIFEFAGIEVFKTQIINDRGIAICKSML